MLTDGFTVKVVRFPDGSVDVIVYDRPVGRVSVQKDSDMERPRLFDMVPVVTGGADGDILYDTSGKSQKDSLIRTKKKILEYARCALWEWFCTLTFNPENVERTDLLLCMGKVRAWLHNQRRSAPDLKYLVVPELHADGVSWHCHALLADVGKMVFADSGHRSQSGAIVYNISGFRWGWSTATRIEDTHRASVYISKYITKSAFVASYGSHRYYASKNLEKPDVVYRLNVGISPDAASNIIAGKLGMKEVYREKYAPDVENGYSVGFTRMVLE